MISQMLNRDFVLPQLRAVRKDLEQIVAQHRRGARPPLPDLTLQDYQLALEQVTLTEEQEAQQSSGQPGLEPPVPERRGQEPSPIDDFSFFSRDPVISLLQSTLEEFLDSERSDLCDANPPADDARRGPADLVAVTDRTLRGIEPKRAPDGRRLFAAFEMADPRWLSVGVAVGIRLQRGRYDFNKLPATPVPISNRSRIFLVGDWGTGLPRAQKVASQMRRVLDEGKEQGLQQHVIHLGDVYYSGWQREYEKRFLQYWPVQPSEADEISSWSLNGNHDMYTGGHAYFEFLLREPRFKKQERSSFFSLYNDGWEILGLDTAYEDVESKGGLMDPQGTWVMEKLASGQRKLLLLSHHQLFSMYEQAGETIANKLAAALSSRRVRCWFWGHEHRCMLYKLHQNVEYARCIGHGGVPTYMWHDANSGFTQPWGEYEYRDYIQKGFERWAYLGFAVLDVSADGIDVRYINEDGYEHHSERIR